MATPRNFPSQQQIQEWIFAIHPSRYFETLVESPGLLILRAKEPPCIYQGLHIAVSDEKRNELLHSLRLLCSGDLTELRIRASSPNGRAWFNLFTSGINFGNKSIISFRVDDFIVGNDAWLNFNPHFEAILRFNSHALSTFVSEVERSPYGGIRSNIAVRRDAKPLSPPHTLWLWQWQNLAPVSL